MSHRRYRSHSAPLWVVLAQASLTILITVVVVVFMLTLIPEVMRLLAPLLLVL